MSEARTYQTPEDMQKAIDVYFDKLGENEKSTISELCYDLGFESRQSFYDYENRYPEFAYTIKRAKLRIQIHYEKSLQGNCPTGSIFALKNFGWQDKHDVEVNSVNPVIAMLQKMQTDYAQTDETTTNTTESSS